MILSYLLGQWFVMPSKAHAVHPYRPNGDCS